MTDGQDKTELKIVTWNINGIRSTYKDNEDMKRGLDILDADIICFQETKVSRSSLGQDVAIVDGYNSYFGFAQNKRGYSGVATFCKNDFTPCCAEEGLTSLSSCAQAEDKVGCYGNAESKFSRQELSRLDIKGRTVITQHVVYMDPIEVNLTIINVYGPRAEPGNEEQLRRKVAFYELLQSRVQALLTAGHFVIIVGDIDTAHKPIDCDEIDNMEEFNNDPCRKWLNHIIYDQSAVARGNVDYVSFRGIDSFRMMHPTEMKAFTCWCTKPRICSTNYGSRIDYILIDSRIGNRLVDSEVKRDMRYTFGSDHSSVRTSLILDVKKSPRVPSFCTKYLPEFAGKQSRLSNNFWSVSTEEKTSDTCTENDSRTTLSEAMEFETASSTMPQNKYRKLAALSKCTKGSSLGKPSTQKSQNSSLGKPNTKKSQKSSLGKPKTQKSQRKISSFFTENINSQTAPETTEETAESVSSVSENASQNFCDVSNSSSPGTPASDICLNYDRAKSSETPSLPPLSQQMQKESSSNKWKKMLSGPKDPPKCNIHGLPCTKKICKRKGENFNRIFWVCCKGKGRSDDSNASCSFFKWNSQVK